MKIKKRFQGIIDQMGRILNTSSNSEVDTYSCDYINEKGTNYKLLGAVNNAEATISLDDDKLSNYRYLVVTSGYGSNIGTSMIPVTVFKESTARHWCSMMVRLYNDYGLTRGIQYINDTQFKILGIPVYTLNGGVGTDTVTRVYGVK